jgi:cell division protein FtsB
VNDDRRASQPPDPRDVAEDDAGAASRTPDAPSDGIDLSQLSVAGITRRRVGWIAAGLISAWIVVVFARQASEASAAAARADQIANDNISLAAEVASLEQELRTIERPEYIALQARAVGIGAENEIAFTLDPSIPQPASDAPGSAALRVGADDVRGSPLDSWLSLLFGPTD